MCVTNSICVSRTDIHIPSAKWIGIRIYELVISTGISYQSSTHIPQHTCTETSTVATHCNTLQHTATHCNTLQHTATHIPQHTRTETSTVDLQQMSAVSAHVSCATCVLRCILRDRYRVHIHACSWVWVKFLFTCCIVCSIVCMSAILRDPL